jgi:hypothetical protein
MAVNLFYSRNYCISSPRQTDAAKLWLAPGYNPTQGFAATNLVLANYETMAGLRKRRKSGPAT